MSNQNSVDQMIALLSQNTELMDALKSAIPSIVAETGDPSFARFSQAFTQVSRNELKPLFGDIKASMKPEKESKSKSPRGPVDNTWREEQKQEFSGRGMQWIFMENEIVHQLLDALEENGVDVMDYREFTTSHGKSWVRYAGPRIVDGNQVAAFEVRTSGSKIPASNQFVYLDHQDVMDGGFSRLPDGKTPHQLGLEVIAQPEEESEEINLADDSEPTVEVTEDDAMMESEDSEEIDLDIF